jgi:tetratricopeptide (TPR) repeat protein
MVRWKPTKSLSKPWLWPNSERLNFMPTRLAQSPTPTHAAETEAYVVAALLHGEWERALSVMEELGEGPAYAPALATSAKSRLAAGAADAARRLAEKALELDPDSAPALRALGTIRVTAKDFTSGEAALRRATELDPSEPSAHLVLGRLYLAQNQIEKAVPHVRALMEAAPGEDALDLLKRTRKAASQALRPGHPALEELRKIAAQAYNARTAPETLTLCLIAKNEAGNLKRVIESVRGLAAEVVVVDTGSTDDTVRLAKRLGAKVSHFHWVDDFAAARNASLEQAAGDWILIMDADDELVAAGAKEIRSWLQRPKADVEVVGLYRHYAYPGKRRAGLTVQPRLFRNRRGLHFTSPVHERLVHADDTPARAEHVINAVMLHHGIDGTATAAGRQARNLKILQPYLEREPRDARGQFYAGTILLEQEQWAAAVPHFQAAISAAEPGMDFLAKAHSCLGYCLLQAGRPLDAEASLREALQHFPEYPDGHYALGLTLDSLGRLPEAAEAHEAALRGRYGPSLNWHDWSSREDRPHIALADLRLALGDVDAALAHVDAAESFTGPSPLYADLRGAIQEAQQEQSDREEQRLRREAHFREAAEAGDSAAGLELVRSLIAGGDLDAAAEALKLTGGVEADLAEAAVSLARGDAAEALRIFVPLRIAEPTRAEAWMGEAESQHRLGRVAEAELTLELYEEVAGPGAADRPLAALYAGQKRWPEAVARFESHLKAHPQDWTSWIELGKALLHCDKVPGGIQCLQRAATINPGSLEVRVALGEARAYLSAQSRERREAVAA